MTEIEVFSIASTTGQLTRIQRLGEWLTGDDFLDGLKSIEISDDGRFFYAAAENDHAITVYSRGTSDGLLQQMQVVGGRVGIDTEIIRPDDIEISSDGTRLYAVGDFDMRTAIMDVDSASGRLTVLESFGKDEPGIRGHVMALADADPFLYVTGDRQIGYYYQTDGLRIADPHLVLGAAGGDYTDADFGLADLDPNIVGIEPTIRPRESNATADMTVTFTEIVDGVDVSDFQIVSRT